MSYEPILIINTSNLKITIRARIDDYYVENDILLNPILAMYRRNGDNIVKSFLDLFESVIKRTINEFMPHKSLNLSYNYIADDDLDHATTLSINLLNVEADDVKFRIDNGEFTISNLNEESSDEKVPIDNNINRVIKTPDIVLKKYQEVYDKRQKELKNQKPKRQYVGENL
ncbi:MAG: hypothetical protein ACI4RQ_02765 [Methanobrevibacter wolinii]|uniref:hypothetical protein n=1 Tax=Methanobrevibacter wolinii TaxID=190977 RepID=UPI0006941EB1|nr:hypothetical protein [Methanobrevibacter wolinii]MDD5959931.1 hypothetical protein [Methanobrevibacter wolinii]